MEECTRRKADELEFAREHEQTLGQWKGGTDELGLKVEGGGGFVSPRRTFAGDEAVRSEILDFLIRQGVIDEGAEPPQELLYPPMATLDWDRFGRVLGDKGETFRQIEHVVPTSVQVRTPIPEIPDSESKG